MGLRDPFIPIPSRAGLFNFLGSDHLIFGGGGLQVLSVGFFFAVCLRQIIIFTLSSTNFFIRNINGESASSVRFSPLHVIDFTGSKVVGGAYLWRHDESFWRQVGGILSHRF